MTKLKINNLLNIENYPITFGWLIKNSLFSEQVSCFGATTRAKARTKTPGPAQKPANTQPSQLGNAPQQCHRRRNCVHNVMCWICVISNSTDTTFKTIKHT